MPFLTAGSDFEEHSLWTAAALNRALQDTAYNIATQYNETYEQEDYEYDEGYDEKKKSPVPLDYTVLSIGIMTLGLILFVEVIRHWIDHQAHGKRFFKAVLLMLYSELATLGIVEFAVFLIIKYYQDLNKAKKEIFGDVHFALFYTAVFNAFQSTLTALFTRNASHRLWVQTEQLELDHYVEIREEYERVQQLIETHQASNRVEKWIRNCVLFVRRPGLRRKFRNLRIQVRFHELRLQFLEAHHLPLNLKVSKYLKRSELGVLISLVHISGTAWLLLTGGLALLYFVLGMVGYKTADADILGMWMTGAFFGLLVAFIIVSVAMQYKMERIFQTIMKTKVDDSCDHVEGMLAQKSLFLFGSPSLVVALIQFMNFGYAIALSVVIMYWPYLTLVEPYWYLVTVFGCYFIFLCNLSVLLPQFTLCTSLGFLTNYKQLQETVAHHRLEEAQRQQRQKMIEKAIEHDAIIVLATHEESTHPQMSTSIGDSLAGTQKTVASVMRSSTDGINPADNCKELLLADLVKSATTTLRQQLPEESRESLLLRKHNRRTSRMKSISDGVSAMRSFSGAAGGQLAKSQGDSMELPRIPRKEEMELGRAPRRKSVSQPGLIKAWQDISATERAAKKTARAVDDAERRRPKANSESRVIKAWQESRTMGPSEEVGRNLKRQTVDATMVVQKDQEDDLTPNWKKKRAASLADRRQARKKSQSASAVIQSWRDFSVTDQEPEVVRSPMDLRSILSGDSSEKDYAITRDGRTIEIDDRTENHQAVFAPEEPSKVNSADEALRSPKDIVLINDECDALQAPPSQASRAGTHADDGADDDDTVNTEKSIGNLSDVDIFDSTRGISTKFIGETVYPVRARFLHRFSPSRIIRDAKVYFLGAMYPTMSHVFGTLVVFFIIGHRVQAFIAESGNIVKLDRFVWADNLLNMYWAEVTWLICFIIADLMILVLFPLWKCKDPRERSLSVATCIDILLTASVLILLVISEAQRCCTDELYQDGGRALADINGADYEFAEKCTCGQWGSRTYTGLGVIEPFTSIIALRVFRFVFAALLVKEMDRNKGKIAAELSEETSKEQRSDPHSNDHGGPGHSDHDHDHSHGGETALELWERAITQNPEIVQKYGQFSGELLQAMLGLHVDLNGSESHSSLTQSSARQELREEKEEDCKKPETWQSHIKLTGKQYSKLPPESQGFIIAGRLGKPVKAMNTPTDHNRSGDDLLPTVNEGTATATHAKDPGLVEFEVDKELMLVEQKTEFSFVSPFARLIRSMRRCDRRQLPLLTKWVSVDVVITQFEIVYFEAEDGELSKNGSQPSKEGDRALLSALQATKGGKGLRLCDVAAGRKVVGHLDLADVTEVHVEEDEEAISDVSLLEKAAERYHSKDDLAVEYWHDPSRCPLETDPRRFARAIRWTIMKEERLNLTTPSGTLIFRFYSDLECAEVEKLGNTTTLHTLSKDIALQWAETVARICGPEQLNQELPHFGENNDDELRDYLQVVHFHNREAEKARKKSDRGIGDLKYLYGEGEDRSFHHGQKPSPKVMKSVTFFHQGQEPSAKVTRSVSFGGQEGGSERIIARPKPPRLLRRSLSMGTSNVRAEDGGECSKVGAPSIV